MNLAEYKRELEDAHREFRDALGAAADHLAKRTAAAQIQFLGEDEENDVMAGEDVRPRKSGGY